MLRGNKVLVMRSSSAIICRTSLGQSRKGGLRTFREQRRRRVSPVRCRKPSLTHVVLRFDRDAGS